MPCFIQVQLISSNLLVGQSMFLQNQKKENEIDHTLSFVIECDSRYFC